jgi:hypothetical protein
VTGTCDHGHPWIPENTRIRPGYGGRRQQRECRECHRAKLRQLRDERWRARHAGHDYTRDALDRRRCLTCPEPRKSLDIDPIAVERAVKGYPPAVLTTGERVAAVQQLTARGLSNVAMAKLIGCSDRTVQRILTRTREAAAA